MSLATGDVVIDACTLVSYHVVGRSDLLRQQFEGSAHWTETIQRETGRLGVTGTDWLGAPIEIGGDSVTEIIAVNRIRAALGARPAENATLHLGEAEIIHHLTAHEPGWTFISDDRVAVDFAIRRGLSAVDTEQIMADCYARGMIGCPAAYELLEAMRQAGRGVRVPSSHWFICPPPREDGAAG